jgi:energy-coupling factor transporter transmembrane protein EcfT
VIILYWIGVFFLFALFVAILAKYEHETFLQSFKGSVVALMGIISFFGASLGITYLLVQLFVYTVNYYRGGDIRVATPTVLICNGTIVGESFDGFSYNKRSGTYIDYRNNITYTPRQGEMCTQVLKGGE